MKIQKRFLAFFLVFLMVFGSVQTGNPMISRATEKSEESSAEESNVERSSTEESSETALTWVRPESDTDACLSMELNGTFPKGSHAELAILKDAELEEIQNSLSEELSDISLPLSIAVLDAEGNELEDLKNVEVRLQLENTDLIKNATLWHQKQDKSWETLEYTVQEPTETEAESVIFTTKSFSPFLFIKSTEESSTENTEKSSAESSEKSQDPEGSSENSNAPNNTNQSELESSVAESSVAESSEAGLPKAESSGADIPIDVEPIIIDEFQVSFASGASLKDGKYIWKATDPDIEHMFIYRADYTTSGVYSMEKGAFKIELPLHILKDRDGNWADTFDCPYVQESEITEGDNPDFLYSIDEDTNTATIYNYKPNFTGNAGYIEFSYSTSKSLVHYVDMGISTSVPATLYATNEAQTVTASSEADPVVIDTQATIAFTQKKQPSFYKTWQSSWGTKPADADDYLYLVWTIRSNINKNTSPYDFYLEDDFSDLGGSVVGYRFAGQSKYSTTNYIPNQTGYGDRYDYVLTRHSKAEAEAILETKDTYTVQNQITATVSPMDHVDADTSASSSKKWTYEAPRYTPSGGYFCGEKYGIYGSDSIVRSSEDVSDYSLRELLEGDISSIDNLKYSAFGEAYPYPWTLADGANGTVNDALNGLYGQKKVQYSFTDDTFYLENSLLNDEDYEIRSLSWSYLMRTAVFDETTQKFKESLITSYQEEDAISIFVRMGSEWHLAAVYAPVSSDYRDVDPQYVENASQSKLTFSSGVNGIRFTCSNAYYRTRISFRPFVSLKGTEHVFSLVGESDKVALTNRALFSVSQNGSAFYNLNMQATDYIQKVIRESELKKDVLKTRNNKSASRFEVTWRITAQEKYTDNEGTYSIYQDSGIFYDLIPYGSVADLSSVEAYASGEQLPAGAYTVRAVENYKDSGRTLLVVKIKEPTKTFYQCSYKTTHSYDSIQDYGKKLRNSVAYETGNEKIAEGYPDDGGTITDKEYFVDLDDTTDAKKFLYTETVYDINILTAASTGLKKQVKNSSASQYAYETTVHKNETYSYQIRLANDANTMAKDIVFFDSLENFFQRSNQEEPTIPSDWKGTLTGIDLSNLQLNDIQSVVYLSRLDNLNLQNHHNLTEQVDGEPVWMEWSQFEETYGLEAAHAIAVDARKKTDGSDFILDKQQSLVFTLYMKTPASEETGSQAPTTYNNIYVERTAIKENGEETIEYLQFYHQDYTQAVYRITGDVNLKKVDETDMETPVSGATYRLRGTSAYGTSYSLDRITDKNGEIQYSNIEKGTYELIEVSCSRDWQLDTELYRVTIDSTGATAIAGLSQDTDENWILADKPRIHADFSFIKIDSVTKSSIRGVKFQLSGTSDYDNEYLVIATSNTIGTVLFSDIELGTYELTEIETPEGYIPTDPWTVKVDERGQVWIKQGDGEYEPMDSSCKLENEPYHSIRFVKTSSYGTNIYLEGAEFSLTGRSDYGTNVDRTAVSASEEEGGLVVFDQLEPGTYLLRETKAPADHELDDATHTVVLHADGTYTISGLNKTAFGGTQLYNFVNLKTAGTIVVTKAWEDFGTNEQRSVPDITLSTILPSKSLAGNTITFHASNGTFANGKMTNEVTYNAASTIVDGIYTEPFHPTGLLSGWYLEKACTTPFAISEDGIPEEPLTEDITVYAKYKTNILKTGSQFKALIPSTATSVVFTDEVMPEDATLIDVDADGDGGVVGWFDGTTFKVSTQHSGYQVYANADSSNMFKDKSGLTEIDLGNLDTSLVTNMYYMFYGCSRLTELDVADFDTSLVTNMARMFQSCSSLKNLDVSGFNTSNVTTMSSMFYGCKSLTSLDVSNFDTSNATDIAGMFLNCSSLTSLDVSNFDTSNVSDMRQMFLNCSRLTSLDVSNFDTSNVTTMESMFSGCKSLTSLDVSNFDTSNATDIAGMFQNCSSLSSLDVSNFDTSKVTNMRYMFQGCSSLTSLDVSNFDTGNVTTMEGTFADCYKLVDLCLGDFNTAKVTNMQWMFSGCKVLTSLDVSCFNTSNVTNMQGMFNSCINLTSLDVSNFDTSNVTTMEYMFNACSSLTSLDVSNFDTSDVTNMGSMFAECTGLTSLDVSNFNTQNVKSMGYMFGWCSKLKSLDLSDFDTHSVTSMGRMFSYCTSLISLDISNFDVSSVTTMHEMFYNCSRLSSVDLSSFNPTSLTNTANMFNLCYSLKTIYASELWTNEKIIWSSWMFSNCNNLVGGNGTKHNGGFVDKTYARIDTTDTPGYFTYKAASTATSN